MEYAICLKWGGLHGHVALQQDEGELLYVLQSSGLRSRRFPVVDARGHEVFRIRRYGLLGSIYKILSNRQTVAIAGSNWLWSHGSAKIPERPMVRCKYGWGIGSTLTFKAGTTNVANVQLQPGVGVRGLVAMEDSTFNTPPFLIATALIFRDWTSRG